MNETAALQSTMHDAAARARAQRLMRTLVGKTLTFFADHEVEQVKKVRDHLWDLADGKVSVVQSQNLRTAATLLDRRSADFLKCYRTTVRECLEEELRSALPEMESTAARPPQRDAEKGGVSLSLIDMQEVDKILLLDRVGQRFNAKYETLISPLTQQIAHLFALESALASINPFHPLVFVRAFLKAWEKGGFDDQATEELMQGLVPERSIDLTTLYEDLTRTLSAAGASTQVVHRIRKTVGGPSGLAPLTAANETSPAPLTGFGPSQPAALQGDSPRSAWGALAPAGRSIATQARAFLQRLGMGAASRQSGAVDSSQEVFGPYGPDDVPHGHHAPADPGLMNYLADMQANAGGYRAPQVERGGEVAHHNVLRDLRERDEIRSAPELDRGTVDALAEVFDFVFADQAIPMQMKVLIGRLQIPVLKAAMIDRDFFLSAEHPARKLVDVLARASVTWAPDKGESDPLYVRIQDTVQRVLTEFEDDIALFSDMLADFTEFLFENEQQLASRIEPVTRKERSRESQAFALAHADELVHGQLADIPLDIPLAPFLTPFLTIQWREVIANAWLQDQDAAQDQSPAAADAGEPSAPVPVNDAAHCQAALKTMEQLIWSTQPKTTSESRRELVGVLPDLVRAINTGLDEIRWDGEPRTKFTKRMIAVHMLAIRMKAPTAQDSQSAALEETESRRAMEALDLRRADKLAGSVDEFDDAAHGLTRGLWFAFIENGTEGYRCRLSWISPLRTRFLFTNREGFDAFVRNEREVAAMLRLGTLILLDQAPIVSRAIDRLMSDNELSIQQSA